MKHLFIAVLTIAFFACSDNDDRNLPIRTYQSVIDFESGYLQTQNPYIVYGDMSFKGTSGMRWTYRAQLELTNGGAKLVILDYKYDEDHQKDYGISDRWFPARAFQFSNMRVVKENVEGLYIHKYIISWYDESGKRTEMNLNTLTNVFKNTFDSFLFQEYPIEQ